MIVGGEPLATLGPGNVFGEMAMVRGGGLRHADVRARTWVALLMLAASDFERISRQFPDDLSAVEARSERSKDIHGNFCLCLLCWWSIGNDVSPNFHIFAE